MKRPLLTLAGIFILNTPQIYGVKTLEVNTKKLNNDKQGIASYGKSNKNAQAVSKINAEANVDNTNTMNGNYNNALQIGTSTNKLNSNVNAKNLRNMSPKYLIESRYSNGNHYKGYGKRRGRKGRHGYSRNSSGYHSPAYSGYSLSNRYAIMDYFYGDYSYGDHSYGGYSTDRYSHGSYSAHHSPGRYSHGGYSAHHSPDRYSHGSYSAHHSPSRYSHEGYSAHHSPDRYSHGGYSAHYSHGGYSAGGYSSAHSANSYSPAHSANSYSPAHSANSYSPAHSDNDYSPAHSTGSYSPTNSYSSKEYLLEHYLPSQNKINSNTLANKLYANNQQISTKYLAEGYIPSYINNIMDNTKQGLTSHGLKNKNAQGISQVNAAANTDNTNNINGGYNNAVQIGDDNNDIDSEAIAKNMKNNGDDSYGNGSDDYTNPPSIPSYDAAEPDYDTAQPEYATDDPSYATYLVEDKGLGVNYGDNDNGGVIDNTKQGITSGGKDNQNAEGISHVNANANVANTNTITGDYNNVVQVGNAKNKVDSDALAKNTKKYRGRRYYY